MLRLSSPMDMSNKKSRRNKTASNNSKGFGIDSVKKLWKAAGTAIDNHLVDEAWSFDDAKEMTKSDKYSSAHADFVRNGAAVERQSPLSEHEDDFISIGGSTEETSETDNRTYSTSAYSTSAGTRTARINGILSCSPRFLASRKEYKESRTPHACSSGGFIGQMMESAGEFLVDANAMCADSFRSVNQTCNEKMNETCGSMKHTNDDTEALNASFSQKVATNLQGVLEQGIEAVANFRNCTPPNKGTAKCVSPNSTEDPDMDPGVVMDDQLNALLNEANINASFSKGEPNSTQKSPPKSNSASIFRQNASPTMVDEFHDNTAKFHDDPINDGTFGGFEPFNHTEGPKMQRNLIFQDLLESEKENVKPCNAKKQTLKPKQSHDAIFLTSKTDSAGFPIERAKTDCLPICNNCGKGGETDPVAAKALKLCSQCQSAYYCSVDCQKEAWVLGHHGVCVPVGKARRL
mmetsp:Transcript_898/g.2085  ORF Transcript_898/g.2085 Transcript_898/m.2085 type:complete len:463 (-) Transcript_898:100-1488(-)